jgi:microcystin degradation protein MlrC
LPQRKFRVIVGQFKHETNSFIPNITDINAYKARNCLFGEEIPTYFRGVKNEIGGFFDALADCHDIELVPVMALDAMPSGLVAMEVYKLVLSHLLEAVDSVQPDGILLSLHGAMVLTESQDGEGDLLEALRARLGVAIPIIASLDLHVNLTEKMMKYATALFPFWYYPHTDMHEIGMRAATAMRDTLRGDIVPVAGYCKLPLLMPYVPTDSPEMAEAMDLFIECRKQKHIIDASFCHGFFPADIQEMGASVVVVGNGNSNLVQTMAKELGQQIWQRRQIFTRKYYAVDQAIDEALSSEERPFVFADVADNPGAGSPGDSTHLFRRLLERGVKDVAIATLCDPEAVAIAAQAGVGAKVHLNLGGKMSPELCGKPVEGIVYVRAITNGSFQNKDVMGQGLVVNMGPTAVLELEGIIVIVASKRVMLWDVEVFRSCGIVPEEQKILVIKSTLHYKASFSKIAYRMLDVELPNIVPVSPSAINYSHCRRPIYPLDSMCNFESTACL